MRKTQYVVIEDKKKKRSPLKVILTIASVLVAVAAVYIAVYKYFENKYRSQILAKIDLDGDGEADAIMLDTTGNGEVDTIILDTPIEEDETEE